MTATRLVLLGPPGAGKGTQAQILAERLGVPAISTGEMFRSAVAEASGIGAQVKAYLDRGELVPDELTVEVVARRLAQPDAREGFILDGFPRTVPQAKALDELLERAGRPVQLCLLLQVDAERVVERLRRRAEIEGRSDDTEDGIRTRLRVYEERTAPLFDYYGDRGLAAAVDGVGGISEVAARIEEAVTRW